MHSLPPMRVPRGEVWRWLGATGRSRLDRLQPRRPDRLRPATRPAPPAPQVVATIPGFLENVQGPNAKALLFKVGSTPRPYTFPSEHFARADIQAGERFTIEVVEQSGRVHGRLRADAPGPAPPPPERYLHPDDLDALSEPW